MSVTSEQVARLRRMVAEATEETYSDEALGGYIERYALLDERGEAPYGWDVTTEPPSKVENDGWVPTYDLYAAAADVWDEKGALAVEKYDFSANDGSFKRGQIFEHCQERARYYRSRRASRTMTLVKWPEEVTRAGDFPWIGNLAEEGE